MMDRPKDEGRVLLVDKPLDWTSFDVVNKIRKKLGIKKVGHAGTLDPLATGLLIICTGKKTREIEQYMGLDKTYTGTLVLGAESPSGDLETEPVPVGDPSSLSEEQIRAATRVFTGSILQVPPAHSAVKVGGTPAYVLARKGKPVELKPRSVHIHEFEITDINLPEVDFLVTCSKGTYIRSLVRDFGAHLKVGAYMAALRRTRIGDFRVEDALTIDAIE
ncbi:MAG TPA: tRNA pseudouridine(55) synthase TruB [Cyclobacteriaceae bacterium]|nr:tRNA pseudouridine(55) synthase TruB [Cyclobacteriaceae bacterium]